MLRFGQLSFVFCALLVGGIFISGCSSTQVVGSREQSAYFPEINRKAQDRTARVTLQSGERLVLNQLRMGADSSSGLSERGDVVSIPTSHIDTVRLKNRTKGAFNGAAYVGGGALLSSSVFNWGLLFSNPSEFFTPNFFQFTGAELGTVALTAVVGAGIGTLSGHNKIYHFKGQPSREQPAPVEEEKRVIAEEERDTAETVSAKTRDKQESKKSETSERDAAPQERQTPALTVDTEIPETEMSRSNDIAVVVGIEDYENEDIPDVEYALEDAQVMKKYLTRTLGFREENIIYTENATAAEMTRIFGSKDNPQGQLYNWVKPGESDIFVYYSGHGAPNPETGDAYFIPSNSNPSYLSQNGYPTSQLYENLSKIPAEAVTVVVEACFSGTSEGGAVVQNVSPAVLSVENPLLGIENALAFTAGAADQVSTWYNEKRHGLFTYYFLKGLRGAANMDGDQKITSQEMGTYLTETVPYRARRLHNREQTPQIVGADQTRVLVQYDGELPTETQLTARLPAATTALESSVEESLSLPGGAKKVTGASNGGRLRSGDVILSAGGTELAEEDSLSRTVKVR